MVESICCWQCLTKFYTEYEGEGRSIDTSIQLPSCSEKIHHNPRTNQPAPWLFGREAINMTKETITKLPCFMVRVQLPNPGEYGSGPSGDNEYDDAYKAALKEAIPPGFAVHEWRHEKWPRADVYTWVPLVCSNPDDVISTMLVKLAKLERIVADIKLVLGA